METLESRNLLTTTFPVVAFQRPYQSQLLPDNAQVVTAATADINQDGIADLIVASKQLVSATPTVRIGETSPSDDDTDLLAPAESQYRLDAFLSDGESGFLAQDLDHSRPVESLNFVTDDSMQQLRLVAAGTDHLTVWAISWNHEGDAYFSRPIRQQTTGQLVDIANFDANDQPEFLLQSADDLHIVPVPISIEQTVEPESAPVKLAAPRQRSATGNYSSAKLTTIVGDVDGDTDMDLIVACIEHCIDHEVIAVRTNDGEGVFSLPAWLPVTELGVIRQIAWRPSTPHSDPSLLVVHRPKGSPTDVLTAYDRVSLVGHSEQLTPSQSRAVPGVIDQLLVAEVDGDSWIDVLLRSRATSALGSQQQHFLLPGQDDNHFAPPVPIPLHETDELLRNGPGATKNVISISSTGLFTRTPIIPSPHFADDVTLYELPVEGLTSQLIDINSDQRLDLIRLNGTTLQFLFGSVEGDFASQQLRFDHLHSIQYYTGHFDSDPSLDLVVVGADLSGGTHVARVEFEHDILVATPFQFPALGIVIEQADLDADGLDDFVFRSPFDSSESRTSILLSRDETWLPQILSIDSATVAIDNLDQDDAKEIFVFADPIRIFKYTNDQFSPWGTIPKGTSRVLQSDLNGDGIVDLLSVFRDGHLGTTISPFINNNDGTWTAWETVHAHQYEILDLNHDGLPDVATSRRLFFNTGGKHWNATHEVHSDTPEWSERDRYIDLNGDGRLDVAKLHLTTGQLSLHVVEQDGTWTVLPHVPASGNEYELVDLNGDDRVDLIELNDGVVSISLQNAAGWDQPQHLSSEARSFRVIQRDADVSAVMDLVIDRLTSFSVYRQTSDHLFNIDSTTETGPTEVADINLDGIPDLVLTDEVNTPWTSLQTVMWGTDYGFSAATTVPGGARGIEHAEWTPAGLRLAEGTGQGESRITILASSLLNESVPAKPFDQRVVDFDDDGDLDVVALHANGLTILHGVGAGDFDRDGRLSGHDLALLQLATNEPPPPQPDFSHFDLNKDGHINHLDLRSWVFDIAGVLPGDADLDGDVDFDDFLRLSQRFGQEGANWSHGDVDCDGRVGFEDFLKLSINFGRFQIDPRFVRLP